MKNIYLKEKQKTSTRFFSRHINQQHRRKKMNHPKFVMDQKCRKNSSNRKNAIRKKSTHEKRKTTSTCKATKLKVK